MDKKNFFEELKKSKEIPLAITATIIIATTTFFIINENKTTSYHTNNKSLLNVAKWVQSLIDSILKNK